MRCAQGSTGCRFPWEEEAQGQACAWVWEVALWISRSSLGACRGVVLGKHFGSTVELAAAAVAAAAARQPCQCSRNVTGGRRRVSGICCQ